MPQAYLFDMDGLLLDSERLALTSFLDTVEPLGVARGRAAPFFLTLVGTSSETTNEMLRGFLPQELAPEEVIALWRQNFDHALHAGVPVKAGVRAVLQELSGQGAVMAVVTSTLGARARAHLAQADLLQHFQVVIGGDEVRATKPDPAPYLQAAEVLGKDPRCCAAFEDSDRGIAAAVAAGCHAVQVPDLRPAGLALPDLGQMVAASLPEAIALVQAKLAKMRMG